MNSENLKQFLSRFSLVHHDTVPGRNDRPELPTAGRPLPEQHGKKEHDNNNTAREGRKPLSRTAPSSRRITAANTGTITKGIVIHGPITSDSDLTVAGVVNGDVTCQGDIDISGHITGNIQGYSINATQAEISGNINAAELVTLSGGTVTGSLTARTAEIDGTINGDLVINELLTVKSNAVIKGDITAASISMDRNATVQGKVAIGDSIQEAVQIP